MDFAHTPDQRALQDSLRRFFSENYTLEARRALVERGGGFDARLWQAYADMGWLGAMLAEDVGGLGLGTAEGLLVLQEAGRALVVEPLAPVQAAAALLDAHGSAAQRAALLPAVAEGRAIVVLAHAEPDLSASGPGVALLARPAPGGGCRLHGSKAVVVGAPRAQHFIVSARVADTAGTTLFLVESGAAGLRRSDFALADGRLAADLQFDGVAVAADSAVGGIGQGAQALSRALDLAALGACAQAVGAMDMALKMTCAYAKTRKQFGQEIGKFQALQHRMADMYIEAEQGRSMLYRALAAFEHEADPARRTLQVAAAKAQVGFASRFVGGHAVQLHGGIGMTNEYAIGHCFKFLTATDALDGNADEQLERVAAALREAPVD